MTKPNITRAQFSTVPSSGPAIPVHFNPTSMQLVVSNEMEPDRPDHHQYVKKTTAKLTMDLIFDTTDKGEDVRNTTKKIETLMKPVDRVPPVALFEWGVFRFQGLVESYRETIDFFSGDGVPLRAGINLTLSQQEQVFEDTGQGGGDGSGSNSTTGGGGGGGGGAAGTTPSADAVDVPPGDDSATDMATEGGDPEAGRDIAAANEEENIRFPSGPMTLDPSVNLGPPVAFASGGAGLGIGAGAGISVGGGIGIGGGVGAGLGIGGGASFGASAGVKGGVGFGASAGFSARGGAGFSAGAKASAGASFTSGASIGAGAGVSAGSFASAGGGFSAGAGFSASAGFKASASAGALFGGSASRGVMASEGAFIGLRAQTRTRRFTLDTSRFIKRSESVSVTTDSGASFRIGGQATFEESTSLSTNVGASASLRTRIRFEEG